MYTTGGTQQLYGLWHPELRAWVRDAGGSVGLFGKAQAEALVEGSGNRLVLKEVFICCDEALVDTALPALRQKWAERGCPLT